MTSRGAIVLGALSIAAFAGVLVWQPASDWQRIGYQALTQLWLPLGLIAVAMFTYKHFIHRRLATELAKLTAPPSSVRCPRTR
ncbi:hypothetical protein [Amycolatopsis sp. GM8]|uniref:hypothetical protein n=1 Tax=Amycolatopsis sp. GM8 TaxID=2896530 RepID=UPI001F1B0F84|nr:hypothetical protein [Amycolatopsis sp. GM8]